jgi:2-C-methyl-D-erythritol 2,4-cyclodiphosphate synthase
VTRVGLGFDIHRLVRGRPLMLGGLHIPYSRGLKGHSDGDVLIHALVDAILGAMGYADIGEFFPDTDKQWKKCSSSFFLKKVIRLMHQKNFKIQNVDSIVIAEEPKLKPFRNSIRKQLSQLLGVKPTQVNVKAKTMEGLGPIGEKKALGAYGVVTLTRRRSVRRAAS